MTAQLIYLALVVLLTGFTLAKHGEIRIEPKYNFWHTLIDNAIVLGLLYWGGFFDVFFK